MEKQTWFTNTNTFFKAIGWGWVPLATMTLMIFLVVGLQANSKPQEVVKVEGSPDKCVLVSDKVCVYAKAGMQYGIMNVNENVITFYPADVMSSKYEVVVTNVHTSTVSIGYKADRFRPAYSSPTLRSGGASMGVDRYSEAAEIEPGSTATLTVDTWSYHDDGQGRPVFYMIVD